MSSAAIRDDCTSESPAATDLGGRSGWCERLVSAWVLASLLFCSWSCEPTHQWWDRLDVYVFRVTNAAIASSPVWREICAATNARAFDLVAAVAAICLLIHASPRPRHWGRELISWLSLAGAVVVAKFLVVDLLIGQWCQFQRASPTLTLESARLSDSIGWVATKDSSPYCFPSDHGIVLLAVAFYVILRSPQHKWLALAVALPLAAPRILSGAHWLTDVVVGSGYVAFAAVSLLMMTPLHDRLLKFCDQQKDGRRVAGSKPTAP